MANTEVINQARERSAQPEIQPSFGELLNARDDAKSQILECISDLDPSHRIFKDYRVSFEDPLPPVKPNQLWGKHRRLFIKASGQYEEAINKIMLTNSDLVRYGVLTSTRDTVDEISDERYKQLESRLSTAGFQALRQAGEAFTPDQDHDKRHSFRLYALEKVMLSVQEEKQLIDESPQLISPPASKLVEVENIRQSSTTETVLNLQKDSKDFLIALACGRIVKKKGHHNGRDNNILAKRTQHKLGNVSFFDAICILVEHDNRLLRKVVTSADLSGFSKLSDEELSFLRQLNATTQLLTMSRPKISQELNQNDTENSNKLTSTKLDTFVKVLSRKLGTSTLVQAAIALYVYDRELDGRLSHAA